MSVDDLVKQFAERMGISEEDAKGLSELSGATLTIIMRQREPLRVAAVVAASLYKAAGVLARKGAN